MPDNLIITEVALPGGGVIGIVPCPGRDYVNNTGGKMHRDLVADLDVLEAWGAQIIISLIEGHEFKSLGVAGFEAAVKCRNLHWYLLPIADMEAPGDAFIKSWNAHGPDILRALEQGRRIVVHCAGGLGRSGMIAAKLMTVFGIPPLDAIAYVREVRPGAIETRAQEDYVMNGPAFTITPV